MSEQPTPKPPMIRILNQNVNKSLECQTDLLNRLDNAHYDIITIQEPTFDFQRDSRATRKWIAVYPWKNALTEERSRAMILVNTELSSNNWTALPIDSLDIAGVELTGDFGKIRIFSIYNAQEHNRNLAVLDRFIRLTEPTTENATIIRDIWIGDFNRHSPVWDELRNGQLFTATNLRAAQTLIDLAYRHSMRMALPHGINTLEHTTSKNWTRPDNVWVDSELIESVAECDILPAKRPNCTDHLPPDGLEGVASMTGTKRGLEDEEDGRDGKRGRFEVVE